MTELSNVFLIQTGPADRLAEVCTASGGASSGAFWATLRDAMAMKAMGKWWENGWELEQLDLTVLQLISINVPLSDWSQPSCFPWIGAGRQTYSFTVRAETRVRSWKGPAMAGSSGSRGSRNFSQQRSLQRSRKWCWKSLEVGRNLKFLWLKMM